MIIEYKIVFAHVNFIVTHNQPMKPSTLPSFRDEELIDLFRTTGTQDYFEAIYHRYSPKVYRQCYQLTKDVILAEDYTHDVFIMLLLKINLFEGRSAFSTWLYSLTRNYCLTLQRQQQFADRLSPDHLEIMPEDYSELEEFKLHLLPKAMGTLPTDDAKLLKMKYYDGLEVAEISKQLTVSTGAVKMRLKRSRAKLKKQLSTWLER